MGTLCITIVPTSIEFANLRIQNLRIQTHLLDVQQLDFDTACQPRGNCHEPFLFDSLPHKWKPVRAASRTWSSVYHLVGRSRPWSARNLRSSSPNEVPHIACSLSASIARLVVL